MIQSIMVRVAMTILRTALLVRLILSSWLLAVWSQETSVDLRSVSAASAT